MLKWEILLSQSGKSCYAWNGKYCNAGVGRFCYAGVGDFVMLEWEIMLKLE